MATHGNSSAGDETLIACLAAGHSYREVVDETGISLRTVCRRMRDPDFREHVVAARTELLESTLGRLASKAAIALDSLAELCRTGEHGERLEACRLMLTNLLTLRGQTDMLARLDGMERLLREKLS